MQLKYREYPILQTGRLNDHETEMQPDRYAGTQVIYAGTDIWRLSKPQGGKKSHEMDGAKTEDWDRSGHTQATSHPASYSYTTIQDQEYQDINKMNCDKSS